MYNTASIISLMRSAVSQEVRLLVLPELVTTAYTCADLFLQKSLQNGGAVDAIAKVVEESKNSDLLVVFGSLVPPCMDGCTTVRWLFKVVESLE